MGLGSESGGRDAGEGARISAREMFGAHGVRSGGGLLAARAALDGHVRVGPPVVFLVLTTVTRRQVVALGWGGGSVWSVFLQ